MQPSCPLPHLALDLGGLGERALLLEAADQPPPLGSKVEQVPLARRALVVAVPHGLGRLDVIPCHGLTTQLRGPLTVGAV